LRPINQEVLAKAKERSEIYRSARSRGEITKEKSEPVEIELEDKFLPDVVDKDRTKKTQQNSCKIIE